MAWGLREGVATMTEGATLHLRSPASPTTRVAPLIGRTARIGRGAQCEVRLDDDELDDVQCVLRKRGERWIAQAVGRKGRVRVDGRLLEGQLPLAFGATLRIGTVWLSLVPNDGGGPIDHEESDVYLVEDSRAETTAEPAPSRLVERPKWHEHMTGDRWHERWVEQRQREQAWETRWRALGATLRPSREPLAPLRERPAPATVRPRKPAPATPVTPPKVESGGSWSLVPVQAEPSVAAAPSASPPMLLALPRPVLRTTEPEEQPSRRLSLASFAAEEGPPTVESVVVEEARREPRPPEPVVVRPEARREPRAPLIDAEWDEPVAEEAGHTPIVELPGGLEILRLDRLVSALSGGDEDLQERPDLLDLFLQRQASGIEALDVSRPAADVVEAAVEPFPDPEPTGRTRPVEAFESAVTTRLADIPDEPEAAERVAWPHVPEAGWPTVQSILAARGERVVGAADTDRPRMRRWSRRWPMPTEPAAPMTWSIPGAAWVCLPAAVAALATGVGGMGLALKWANGDRAVGAIADRLANAASIDDDVLRRVGELEAALPAPSWTNTTADQLTVRLAAASHGEQDAVGRERLAMLVGAGRSSTPAEPGPRLARAWRDEARGVLGERVGLGRDAVATSWSAHQLLAAGKVDAALALYGQALERVGRMPLSAVERAGSPSEAGTRRFALPYEGRVGPIVRDLIETSGRPMADWESALPRSSIVALAAARLLVNSRSEEADRALSLAVEWADRPAPKGFDPAAHRAAGAEAAALAGRLDEAARRYREAIDTLPKAKTGPRDYVARSWAYNLADLYDRLNDSTRLRAARAEALDSAPGDDITALVVQGQMRDGVGLRAARLDGAGREGMAEERR